MKNTCEHQRCHHRGRQDPVFLKKTGVRMVPIATVPVAGWFGTEPLIYDQTKSDESCFCRRVCEVQYF